MAHRVERNLSLLENRLYKKGEGGEELLTAQQQLVKLLEQSELALAKIFKDSTKKPLLQKED